MSHTGQYSCINLASDVPPVVDSLGFIPTIFFIELETILVYSFDSDRNESPVTVVSSEYSFSEATLFNVSFIHFFCYDLIVCYI